MFIYRELLFVLKMTGPKNLTFGKCFGGMVVMGEGNWSWLGTSPHLSVIWGSSFLLLWGTFAVGKYMKRETTLVLY